MTEGREEKRKNRRVLLGINDKGSDVKQKEFREGGKGKERKRTERERERTERQERQEWRKGGQGSTHGCGAAAYMHGTKPVEGRAPHVTRGSENGVVKRGRDGVGPGTVEGRCIYIV